MIAQHSLVFSYQIQSIQNRIAATPYIFGVPTSYVNQKKALLENLGIEGKINFGQWIDSHITGLLTARGVYYLRYQDEQTQKNLPYLPEWKGVFGLSAGLKNLFSLGFEGVYSGEFTDGFTQKKLGNTFSLDSKVAFTPFDFWSKDSIFNGLAFEFQVKNLTNQKLVWVDGYPMPGRSFEAGFSYRYPF
jgi:hypothetical protein